MDKARPAPDKDEPRATLEHIFRESGEKPKRKTMNQLVRFWEKWTAEAQARGAKHSRSVEEKETEP